MAKRDKHGNPISKSHGTYLTRREMDCEAWRNLSSAAQSLYPWLRMEWKGKQTDTNGRLFLSIRQAAKAMGKNQKTCMTAFQQLQAKGYIVVTKGACLGILGQGKSHHFRLTNEPTVKNGRTIPPTFDFLKWKLGHDFPVVKIVRSKNKTPIQ